MTLALRYSATSDVGRVRKNNQDSGFASEQLLVVADGMGGAAAGDLASAVTVQTMRRLHGGDHADDMLTALAGAVQRANDRLGEIIEEDPSVEGMGTTVTAIMFDGGDRMGLAHIGDSRAYLLRDDELRQLTSDHTFVQGLVDEGRITESEARTHPHRSLLLRALDGRHDAEPDLTTFDVRSGDRLLICSDGLCGYVDDAAIAQGLRSGTPDASALELLQLALDAGGPDNITCVVGDVVDDADGAGAVDPDSAAAAVGPMLVGAAAEQARGRMSDTATQPAVGAGTGAADDDADPEALRYAPRAPRRFRWVKRIALLVVLLGLVGLGANAAYDWTQGQYYVADSGETVAIYQGIHADVPGVRLSSLYRQSEIELAALPQYWRTKVQEGIDATDLANAHNIVRQLKGHARPCEPPQPDPSPSPDQSPSPGDGGTARSGGDGDRPRRDAQRSGERTAQSSPASDPNGEPTREPTASPSDEASPAPPEDECVGTPS
ncbi:MAG: protein phosphatase 2C domain-containing protein [Actinomycetota bacterium]|nr:protein phosphatase 2C domain-containing protein [Actinomycetota bacterium]